MNYTDERFHLRVAVTCKQCHIPDDERARMQDALVPLGEAVRDFANSDLAATVIYHPLRQAYHIEARLTLPGRTLFLGEWDPYLDSAFHRCVRKLCRAAEEHAASGDRQAAAEGEERARLGRAIMAPEDSADGPVGESVRDGDYRAFRVLLSGYEDWLRQRIGRWIQRYPQVEAQLGRVLSLSDLVEGVYLNAFEDYLGRPTDQPLHAWLASLIDPSVKMLVRHPDAEQENARLARTLREMPLR